jgi:hypothetical protein
MTSGFKTEDFVDPIAIPDFAAPKADIEGMSD